MLKIIISIGLIAFGVYALIAFGAYSFTLHDQYFLTSSDKDSFENIVISTAIIIYGLSLLLIEKLKYNGGSPTYIGIGFTLFGLYTLITDYILYSRGEPIDIQSSYEFSSLIIILGVVLIIHGYKYHLLTKEQ